ncbi:hypothetical protein RhiirA4_479465 [Rhizophagus irregularis]|uniref:Uncharacterized protein n=1 Tax=Rhizophagus irregularis TaxID=588596 RepID=A0A2I1HGH7_9GLOM|nr:hypothetical protein RhiirA4_479465 [Rhizophagus irregularis]
MTRIGFVLDQLVSASRLWIFQISIDFRTLDFNRYRFDSFGFELASRLWILIGRYRFDSFGFELVSALELGFWISIGFGSLDLIGIGSGSLGFGSVGFASLDISDRTLDFRSDFGFWIGIGFEYLDFGSVSTSDPWFYTLNRLISFEYWMDSLLILVIVVNSNLH